MNIEWIDIPGGKGVKDGEKHIASVWLATTGKHYMFLAATSGWSRVFWYADTEEKAMQLAEDVLRHKYFASNQPLDQAARKDGKHRSRRKRCSIQTLMGYAENERFKL